MRQTGARAPADFDGRRCFDHFAAVARRNRAPGRGNAMRVGELFEYGWQDEYVDELRIELRSPARHDDPCGLSCRSTLAIAPAVRDCVERVRECDNARGKGNATAAKAARIASAVPALMMCEHRGG